jgi:hypothetical protein
LDDDVAKRAVTVVTLSWDASIGPDLSSYKVYIGTSSGVYAVSTVDVVDVVGVTICTITALRAGSVYYAAVTAYNPSGGEGGFSNEVNATVP